MDRRFILGDIELNEKQKKLWKTLIFFARLLVLSVPLYLIMFFIDLSFLQHAVATNSYIIFKTFGFEVIQNGINLTVGSVETFSFFITADCTGWKSMIFLFALIFAVPGIVLKKRLFGLLFGIPLIWAGNLLRVLTVVLIEGSYGVEFAMMMHDYLWRVGLPIIVILIWIFWIYLNRESDTDVHKYQK